MCVCAVKAAASRRSRAHPLKLTSSGPQGRLVCAQRSNRLIHSSVSWPFLQGHPEGMKMREGGRRFGPTSALLGATKTRVHQCDAGGALRAPQTVALEHEY